MIEMTHEATQWPAGIPVEDTGIIWRFSAAFLLVSILAFMRLQYAQRIGNNLRAFATPRYLRLLNRDDFNIFHPHSILSFALLCVSLAILIYQYCRYHGYTQLLPGEFQVGDVLSILLIAGVACVIMTMRSFVYAAVMWLLGYDGGQLENRYAQVVFGQVTGLIITPLAVVSLFADDIYLEVWCYLGIGIFALSYLYRVVRGIIAAFNQQVSAMYIIYYLCTLEIVPAAIVVGILTR